MAVRWIGLIGIASVVMLVVCAAVFLILLLSRPSTRSIGVGILGVAGACLLFFFMAMFLFVSRRSVSHHEVHISHDGQSTIRRDVKNPDGRDDAVTTVVGGDAADDSSSLDSVNDAERSRPGWVDEPARLDGNVYRVTVVSDPYITQDECIRSLDPKLAEVTRKYVSDLLGDEAARGLNVEGEFVRERIVYDQYAERYQSSVGPMWRVHANLRFDESVQRELRDHWRAAVLDRRLLLTGGGGLALLALLGTLFGYLKLDTATRGYYTRRLQLAAGVVILAIVALGVILAEG